MRSLVLIATLLTGAFFSAPATAQTPDLPGLDQTIAYIRERCDGASVNIPGAGQLHQNWSVNVGAKSMTFINNWDGNVSTTIVPLQFVTFDVESDSPMMVARCSDSYLLANCPSTNGANYRYVAFFCRERSRVLNAFAHLKTLWGGPAPASDPFA